MPVQAGMTGAGVLRRREHQGGLDLLDGLRDGLADQVQLADLLDTLGGAFQFALGQQMSEEAADIGEGDDDNIARAGDLVAEEHVHDPQLDFPLGLAVNDGVAPRAERPEKAIFLALENAGLDEAVERAGANLVGILGQKSRPVGGVRNE